MSDQQTVPPQTEHRGEPDSPLELPAQDLKQGLRAATKQFKADKGTLISAGMAFYWFLAVFPAILAAVGVIGLVHAGPQVVADISKAIRTTLPGNASKVLTDALDAARTRPRGSSLAATVVGIALALWSASAGMVALQTGMDVVYKVPQERTFLKKRARAMVLIVVAIVLGGVATTFIVFGQPLGQGIRDHLPFGSAFILLWTLIRWAIGLAALSGLFAAFYYFGPNRDTPRWTWLSPGGLVGTAIWLLASIGFSFYVSSLSSYAKTYGSLTGVVVLLLWLYLTAVAIVLGGEVNAGLEMQAEEQREKGGRFGRRRRRRDAPETVGASLRRPSPSQPQPPSPPADVSPTNGSPPSSFEQQWMESMRRLRDESNRRSR